MESNCTSNVSVLTDKEKYYLLLIMGIGGIAAVLICIIALVMGLMFKLQRFFVHRLAMYQVLAALFFAIVCVLEMPFINYDRNIKIYRPLCMVVGFLQEYTIWVKLLMMIFLTFHLFCFAVCYTNFKRLEWVYVTLSIFIPLLFTWVPFIDGVYGQAGAWCWIQNWKEDCADNKLPDGEIEEYALLYGPAFVCLTLATLGVVIIVVVLSWRAYCQTNSSYGMSADIDETIPLVRDEQQKKALKEILPLVVYPLLFIAFFIPPFANRIKGAIIKNASISSFIWSAVTTPCLSLFAGLTFIIHIMVLQCQKPLCHKLNVNYISPFNITGKVIKTNLFTSETVASTDGRSQWKIPNETEIDNQIAADTT